MGRGWEVEEGDEEGGDVSSGREKMGRVSTLAIMRPGARDPHAHIDTHKVGRDKQDTLYAHTSITPPIDPSIHGGREGKPVEIVRGDAMVGAVAHPSNCAFATSSCV